MKNKYTYDFDLTVMHPLMVRAFGSFFQRGNVLELGSGRGDFTQRLLPYFHDIVCVDSSEESIDIARNRFEGNGCVSFIHSTFKKLDLYNKYNNIIMTHVLEHVDDPVSILRRINNEWLSNTGRLFLVCPNANAPSRQIAVKMSIISHTTAVSDEEWKHGHLRTYDFNSLERGVKEAGLKVVHRTGIFFKALANYQWDEVIKANIVSPEYLEGCYQLGQQYPDLCSSIFLLCEKGAAK